MQCIVVNFVAISFKGAVADHRVCPATICLSGQVGHIGCGETTAIVLHGIVFGAVAVRFMAAVVDQHVCLRAIGLSVS